MSIWLQNKLHPSLKYFQTLLNAYFEGLLPRLKEPTAGQLETLAETLQENGFEAIKAEYIYTVVKEVTTYDPNNQPVTRWVQAEDLPPLVGDALNLLNSYAQSTQLLQESLSNFDWQLFTDWYRIFMMPAQQQTCYNIAYQKYGARTAQVQQLATATATLNGQKTKLEALLPKDCKLRETPAPRFLDGQRSGVPAQRQGAAAERPLRQQRPVQRSRPFAVPPAGSIHQRRHRQ